MQTLLVPKQCMLFNWYISIFQVNSDYDLPRGKKKHLRDKKTQNLTSTSSLITDEDTSKCKRIKKTVKDKRFMIPISIQKCDTMHHFSFFKIYFCAFRVIIWFTRYFKLKLPLYGKTVFILLFPFFFTVKLNDMASIWQPKLHHLI